MSASLRASEKALIFYLAITGILLVAFNHNVASWWKYLLLHIAMIGFLFIQTRWIHYGSHTLEWIRRLLPVAAGMLYFEVATLNDLFYSVTYFDNYVVEWEKAIFGGQMALEFRHMLPSRWLSEYFHLAYLAFYLIPPSLSLVLAFQKKWNAFEEATFAYVLAVVVCMPLFYFLPSHGALSLL